jgi:KaiC/GvpD/RAD55 family RecA-like ATPase
MAPYKVDDVLPPEIAAEVSPGRNLLISGPPMSGKRELLLKLLARGAADDEGSIIVSSRERATDLVDSYDDLVGGDPARVSVIDCVSSQSELGDLARSGRVKHVSSPEDLTGIGMQFSDLANDAEDAGLERVRVGLDSLSPMLMYVDIQRLFRFLHVFTSQIAGKDWLGVFVVEPTSHDDQAVNTLQQLFDGVIELRVTDDGTREARVRGIDGADAGWVALDQ